MVRESVARVIDGKIVESIIPNAILRKSDADATYTKPSTFIQLTAASTWIVDHPLGRQPVVNVYVDDNQVDADIIVTNDKITVVFPSPLAGKITYV